MAGDLLSRRAWTRADLAARLRRRGAPADVATEVVDDLVARGYVDDAAFARHWVTARAARGYGAGRLRLELRARGIAAPVSRRCAAAAPIGWPRACATTSCAAGFRPAWSCASCARAPASQPWSERGTMTLL